MTAGLAEHFWLTRFVCAGVTSAGEAAAKVEEQGFEEVVGCLEVSHPSDFDCRLFGSGSELAVGGGTLLSTSVSLVSASAGVGSANAEVVGRIGSPMVLGKQSLSSGLGNAFNFPPLVVGHHNGGFTGIEMKSSSEFGGWMKCAGLHLSTLTAC